MFIDHDWVKDGIVIKENSFGKSQKVNVKAVELSIRWREVAKNWKKWWKIHLKRVENYKKNQ
jgi:hypothetical protein